MDRLRQTLAGISKNLGSLSASHKLLIGALVVIVVMAMILVAMLSSRQAMKPVMPGMALAEQQKAQAFLEGAGIKTKLVGGNVVVAADEEARARSLLAEANQLPSDKALFFETLLDRQSVFNSKQQNDQQYRIALMNELGRMIRGFKGVKSAQVQINVPEAQGLGRQVQKPTASVAVMSTGGALPQNLVDAIGALVSGSLAGLEPRNVQILDLAAGRARRAEVQDDVSAATYMEHAARIETETQRKIEDLLQYIPGVIVAVTAQVDVTRVTANVTTHMPDKKGSVSMIARETEESTTSTETRPGAEPGPMSNQTADINRAGGGGEGSKSETASTTREFTNSVGTRNETIVDPKGYPTRIAVSVNVPKGFVSELVKSASGGANPASGAAPAADAAPSEAQIRAVFDSDVKPAIIAALLPHIRTLMNVTGQTLTEEQLRVMASDSIGVSLIPIDVTSGMGGMTLAAGGAIAGGGGGLGSLLGEGSGMVQTVVLGVLAVVALAMMFGMVRKAGRQAPTPTAEELVGLPPALELESHSDLIGEAGESETAMTGIEVDESALQSQKMLEQVGDLVSKDPEATARIINRWLSADEP